MRGVSAQLKLTQMTWLSTLLFHPPQDDQDAEGSEQLMALIELKDLRGQPQGCLRLKDTHELHKLAPGDHTLWLLTEREAQRPYLFAIEKRR
jgi:hypothetical protein